MQTNVVQDFYRDGNRDLLPYSAEELELWQGAGVEPVSLREVLRVYLKKLIGSEPKNRFADRMGIPRPDVINATNQKGNVSLGMLQKIAAGMPRPMSQVLLELAGVALDMESRQPPRGVARADLAQEISDERLGPRRAPSGSGSSRGRRTQKRPRPARKTDA